MYTRASYKITILIYDIFTFNGEYDLLEIRLNMLSPYVDKFVIVEAPTTFSGKSKPLYYELQKERYSKWHDKIIYFVIDENYSEEEIKEAEESPNTVGAAHWKHEFLQKESIKKALVGLNDDDICLIGDVDEIWTPAALEIKEVFKLRLEVYSYFLNYKSSEKFFGTLVAPYKVIKENCLNHLRSRTIGTSDTYGWHFTSMGGLDEVRRKLEDSYTSESYYTNEVRDKLAERFGNADYIGRGFSFVIDESTLPQWLLDNKATYAHLFKG